MIPGMFRNFLRANTLLSIEDQELSDIDCNDIQNGNDANYNVYNMSRRFSFINRYLP